MSTDNSSSWIAYQRACEQAGLAPEEIPLIVRDPKDPSRPMGMQQHQWDFVVSPAYATFLAGGWFSGKSYALTMWLATRAFTNPPGTSGMVVLPTYSMLGEYISQYLTPAFGTGSGGIITGGSEDKRELYLRGNRRLCYQSAHDPKRIEQKDLCYIGADEVGLMKRDVHVRMVARLRDARASLPFLGFTGVPVHGWLQDEFEGHRDMQRRIITAKSSDNAMVGQEALKNLLDACPARLRPCYIDGRFVPPGNSVFPMITADRHLVDWRPGDYTEMIDQYGRRYRERSSFGIVYDPGSRTPHVLFVQLLPVDTVMPSGKRITKPSAIVVDELYPGGRDKDVITTTQLAHMVDAKGYRISFAYQDPAGGTKEQTSGTAPAHIMADVLGIQINWTNDPKLTSIVNGIEILWHAFAPADGVPTLYFSRSLAQHRNPRAVWNAVRTLHYPADKDGKPLSSKPDKDGITDHATDCLRYFVINDRDFIPPAWYARVTQYRWG